MDEQAAAPPALDFIAEHSGDVIIAVNRQGRVTYVSPAARRFGYEPRELLGPFRLDLVHPDDLESFTANNEALLRGELDVHVRRRHRFRLPDGRWVWFEGNPQIVRDDEGNPGDFINIFRDVSHRCELETAAREQAELFEAAFRHAAIGMALVGLDGTFLRVNPAFCRITGYACEDVLALDFQTITHPEDLDADLCELERLRSGAIDSYDMDKRYLRADGSVVWVHLTVSMVRHPDGSPKHYVAQAQDQSARRAAEAALRASEARYRLIAENTSDMIVMSGLDGVVTYMSAAARRMGWEDVVGNRFDVRMHPADAKAVERAFARLLAGRPAEAVRWRGFHWRGGECVWMESSPSLLRDPATGAPAGFLDVVRDVTQQVQQEQALADARSAAEAAAAAKSQFLANMSHEIRTPLTAVLGYADLLRDDPAVQGEAAGYVDRIAGAGKGLLAIVNDVLDFSKLEAGKFEVRPRPTEVVRLCEETLTMFASQAEAKGLALAFAAEPGAPELAMLDSDRLRQALINLIGNAVKFTEAGVVSVQVAPARGGKVAVQVRDTGPGLDAEACAKLFQRFSQVDGSTSRRHGGTGLGLAICRGLAEAMGGSVEVESTPGRGAAFTLTLPAPPVEGRDEDRAEPEGLALGGLRVLVVDDNGVNRELARRLLEAAGASVREAGDGAAALARLADEPADVVLMDLRMPGLDGRQTLARLRADGGPNRAVPVLAFTADADVAGQGDLEVFDGLVRKPIQPLEMYAAVALAWRGECDERARGVEPQ